MIHLGDITKIKGNEAPTVDCIIGGSPCQDLSLAGKRAGLAGARSGLYMEQIRIIKEMREADVLRGRANVDVRPRYMVWENVPGAFSTNQGQDFAAVLEEAIRVAEPQAPTVPVPEKGWPTAGCFMGECWSVAWRVLDAQFWGTSDKPLPQRRRRIALVADFGGLSAPEILFVRKGVSGDIEPGKPKGKEAPGNAGESSGGASKAVGFPLGFRPENVRCYDETATTLCNGTRPGFTTGVIQEKPMVYGISPYHSNCMKSDNPHSGYYEAETSRSLDAMNCGYPGCNQGGMAVVQPVVYSIENHPADSRVDIDESGKVQTLTSRMGTGGGNVPMVMEPILLESNQNHATVQTNGISTTLTASMGMGGGYVPMVTHPVGYEMQAFGKYKDSGIASALKARDYKDATDLVVAGVDCRNATEYPEMNGTIQSKPGGGNQVVRVKHLVRRLTPLECERLQGFPDGWTDIGEWVDSKGKKHKEADSPRYKALGNSIALPPWKWVLKRLCACYERDATMASLFDGIGGFPLIWEWLNGKGSCLWASEIEEFPIAVTKVRFGE